MPTIKQKKLAKALVENSSSTMAEAMIGVGYAPNTAIKPSQVINSVGFQELLEKYLPDDKLLTKHDEALEATKVISAKITGMNANEQTDDFIDVPDHMVRLKAVELGYKIKGKLTQNTVNVLNQGDMSLEFTQ